MGQHRQGDLALVHHPRWHFGPALGARRGRVVLERLEGPTGTCGSLLFYLERCPAFVRRYHLSCATTVRSRPRSGSVPTGGLRCWPPPGSCKLAEVAGLGGRWSVSGKSHEKSFLVFLSVGFHSARLIWRSMVSASTVASRPRAMVKPSRARAAGDRPSRSLAASMTRSSFRTVSAAGLAT